MKNDSIKKYSFHQKEFIQKLAKNVHVWEKTAEEKKDELKNLSPTKNGKENPTKSSPLMNFLIQIPNYYDQLTLRKPGIFPTYMTGLLPNTLATTGIALGSSYVVPGLIKKFINKDLDKKKLRKTMLWTSLPFIAISRSPDFWNYPVNKWIGYGPYPEFGNRIYSPYYKPQIPVSQKNPNTPQVKTAHEKNSAQTEKLKKNTDQDKKVSPAEDLTLSLYRISVVYPLKNNTDFIKHFKVLLDHIRPEDRFHHINNKSIQSHPHITLITQVNDQQFVPLLSKLSQLTPPEVEFGPLGLFESDHYDVLYLKVHSPELEKQRKFLEKIDYRKKDQYTYIPHVTIAYLKKGTADPYLKLPVKKWKTRLDRIHVASKKRDLISLPLPQPNLEHEHALAILSPHDAHQPLPAEKVAMFLNAPQEALNRKDPFYVQYAIQAIQNDPTLNPYERAFLQKVTLDAARQKQSYLITTPDLIRAAAGAGLGYLAGSVVGKGLSFIFNLPPATQRAVARTGAVGGVLRATGIWGD